LLARSVLYVGHEEDPVIDVRQLAGALDLWLCMWEPDEQERYETAVVRALTDENPRPTRLQALALSNVIDTPRLAAAAQRVSGAHIFPAVDIRMLELSAQPLKELLAAGCRLRGNVLEVEQLLARFVTNRSDRHADVVLDWVDVRDLVAVARTTMDARLFGEIERRIARRGKYQQGRAANILGFQVRIATSGTRSSGERQFSLGGK
jgi:hypothetical protein